MILDENLFGEIREARGTQLGTKRGKYIKKPKPTPKLSINKVYDELDKLGYNVFADKGGFKISKFKEASLGKAKDYLDSVGVPYSIKLEGYPKKYWMQINVSGLSESYVIKHTKKIVECENHESKLERLKGLLSKRHTKTEDLTQDMLQDLKDADKQYDLDKEADRQAKVELAKQGIIKESVSKDKLKELANRYSLKVTIFDDEGKQFFLEGDPSKRDAFYKEYVELFREDERLKEDITDGADGTNPKNGTKYYIKVRTDDKDGIGASYVYGKIKEFPDGVKIGLHKSPYDELIATDVRTGMRIIGSHSPIYKGDERIEPKRKQSELFDQAHELLKSIDSNYYNSIPSIESEFDLENDKIKSEEELYFKKDDLEESLQIKLSNLLKEDLSQEEQTKYGLNTLVNDLIKSELDAINDYNSAIVSFEAEGRGEFTDVIRDISNEEHTHVGQLQAILAQLQPSSATNISDGIEEGDEQLAQGEKASGDITESVDKDKWYGIANHSDMTDITFALISKDKEELAKHWNDLILITEGNPNGDTDEKFIEDVVLQKIEELDKIGIHFVDTEEMFPLQDKRVFSVEEGKYFIGEEPVEIIKKSSSRF